jgi:ABC-type branched-subunit amino acid transport system ATPase component
MVTGYLGPDSGRVRFAGQDVTGVDAGTLYRRGLSRTFQQARVIPQLSVLENLVAAGGYSWRQLLTTRRVGRADRDRAGQLLEEFRLSHVADLLASELSYGQRKLLEFAAVLMSDPTLVLLDEPTAGVNPVLVEQIEQRIRDLNARGLTFLLVEHNMNLVMRLSDPVVVLDHGTKLAEGAPDTVRNDPRVLDAYLGG